MYYTEDVLPLDDVEDDSQQQSNDRHDTPSDRDHAQNHCVLTLLQMTTDADNLLVKLQSV